MAKVQGAVANVVVAARIVVQGNHRVAHEAKPFRIRVRIVGSAEDVLAQLIGARGKTHCEQAAGFAFMQEAPEFSGLVRESCSEVFVTMKARDAVSATENQHFARRDLIPERFDVFLAHAACPEKRHIVQAKPFELAQVPAKVAPRKVLTLHLVTVLGRFGHRQEHDALVVYTAERTLDDVVIMDEATAIVRAVNERRTLHAREVQS